ncbi:hypothetical protein GS597_05195 [Synechococcales cyanobacterium C]|uniref:Uncharacterized protein n=1 Tax=Petrachloros mirabilis ULC683 TaxID=2781853 RepID=A0A8K1ZYE1_9CYAN|nr:hypothetical protein [Petrachloros mirabilis]NCJ05917.1 hypothetical protein [Petrachloros mirabilis ULC683]
MRLQSMLIAASAGVALALGAVSTGAMASGQPGVIVSTAPSDNNASAWVGELSGRVINNYKAPPNTRVVCSSHNPLAGQGELLASADMPRQFGLAANVVDIFCRDVRINTIVARHFCTVLRV